MILRKKCGIMSVLDDLKLCVLFSCTFPLLQLFFIFFFFSVFLCFCLGLYYDLELLQNCLVIAIDRFGEI